MTPHTKRKLVKRLSELSDGKGIRSRVAIYELCILLGFDWVEVFSFLIQSSIEEERTLAGFAAAYLETET
jgi:hypothetical protein